MTYLFVFVAMIVADVIWAEWSKAVGAKQPHRAAAYAVGIVICSGFVAIEYVHNHLMLLPAGAGAYLGTWWSVRRGH